MADSVANRKVYWDSCVWIEYADDSASEDRRQGCKKVIRRAKTGKLDILTSVISIVEACSIPASDSGELKGIPVLFQLDYVALTPANWEVIMLARTLMLSGYRKLKPYDAIHLSSAITHNADELHTFDNDLLKLDEKISIGDGCHLKICWPSYNEELPIFHDADKVQKEDS